MSNVNKAAAPRETGSGMERFNAIKPGTNVGYSLLFILLALICIVPVVFVIIISFSSEASIGRVGYSFLPDEWSLNAYNYVWRVRNSQGIPTVIMATLTSLGITLVGTCLGLVALGVGHRGPGEGSAGRGEFPGWLGLPALGVQALPRGLEQSWDHRRAHGMGSTWPASEGPEDSPAVPAPSGPKAEG